MRVNLIPLILALNIPLYLTLVAESWARGFLTTGSCDLSIMKLKTIDQ